MNFFGNKGNDLAPRRATVFGTYFNSFDDNPFVYKKIATGTKSINPIASMSQIIEKRTKETKKYRAKPAVARDKTCDNREDSISESDSERSNSSCITDESDVEMELPVRKKVTLAKSSE